MPRTKRTLGLIVPQIKTLGDANRFIDKMVRLLEEQHRTNRDDMEALEARVTALEP